GLFILALTQNPNLFPTVIMLGNLLVPVAYVAFFYQRRHLSDLNLPSVAAAFFWGGVLGTFAAALLEPLFIRRLDFATAFVVGAIEELAKMLGVLVVARSRRHDREIDGLILGAAAGMGFAALESTGYAFTAFLASRGSLSDAVAITLLAGVLFREGAATSFRLNRKVVGAYLLVVALHGLWDGLPDAVSFMLPLGVRLPAGPTIVGIVSLVLLRRRWVEAVRMLEQAPAPDQLEAASG